MKSMGHTSLGKIATLNYGKGLPKKKRVSGDIPVYGSNGIVGWHNSATVNKPGIIVGRKGSVGAVNRSLGPFCPIDTTYFITSDDCKVDIDFLYYALLNLDLKRLVSDLVPGLNRDLAYAETLWIPNSNYEQRQVAAILSTVQRAIEQQERLIELTTELKKALMHKLFTEGTRGEPQKETEIGMVPESWLLGLVGELYEVKLGKMLSKKAKVGISPKPYMRNANVQWGRVDIRDVYSMDILEKEESRYRLKDGDLLICEGGDIGRSAIWQGEIKECYYQKAIHRLRPVDDKISNPFLCYWMMYSFHFQNIYGLTGTKTTIAHLPAVKLKSLLIPIPDPAEQKYILRIMSIIDHKLNNLEIKKTTLNDLFRTLLHQLMTAQIRVNDIDLTELGLEAEAA